MSSQRKACRNDKRLKYLFFSTFPPSTITDRKALVMGQNMLEDSVTQCMVPEPCAQPRTDDVPHSHKTYGF